jgi:beta-glucosidase
MAAFLSSLLAASALLTTANAQNFGGGGQKEGGFSYVQPLNTTIYGEYGHSPAVYPSREYCLFK